MTRSMWHIILSACFGLMYSQVVSGQPHESATVHLVYFNFRGEEIKENGTVKLFQSRADKSKNIAGLFYKNNASDIPYGVYHLNTYIQGYYSVDRDVLVFQPEIWVSIQLLVGEENGPERYVIAGSVNGAQANHPVWVSAHGLHSTIIGDTKVRQDRRFNIGGLPRGTYILIITQQNRVLDMRIVKVPSDETNDSMVPIDIQIKEQM